MPYIKQEDREYIADGGAPQTAGELNYVITKVILSYWRNGLQNYQGINDIVGALEGAKAEFQRRIVSQYEDHKIEENGDVYQ